MPFVLFSLTVTMLTELYPLKENLASIQFCSDNGNFQEGETTNHKASINYYRQKWVKYHKVHT